jgi:hypothetical protein
MPEFRVKPLKSLDSRSESHLDFVVLGLGFVVPDLVFVASGLVFVAPGL